MAVIMLAQRYISSGLVAIVASSTAIWITLFDVPMWRRNFRHLVTLGGLLLGFAGVAMLYMEQLDGDRALIYLIVFGSLLAYSAYVWLLKVRPATEVATHAYVNPVVAVIIGGLGGEEITMIQLVGLTVMIPCTACAISSASIRSASRMQPDCASST